MTINIKCAVVAKMSDNSLLFFKVFGNQSEVKTFTFFFNFCCILGDFKLRNQAFTIKNSKQR